LDFIALLELKGREIARKQTENISYLYSCPKHRNSYDLLWVLVVLYQGFIVDGVYVFLASLYSYHFVNVILKIYRISDAELVESRIVKFVRNYSFNYIVGVLKVMGILIILNPYCFQNFLGIKHASLCSKLVAILNIIIPLVGPFFIGAFYGPNGLFVFDKDRSLLIRYSL